MATTTSRDPASPPPDGTCHFYTLPRELRDYIYQLAFTATRAAFKPAVEKAFTRPIYHTVNKQWSAEATPIFLRRIDALFGSPELFEECITSSHMRDNLKNIILAMPCSSSNCDSSCGSPHSKNGEGGLPKYDDRMAAGLAGLASSVHECPRLETITIQIGINWVDSLLNWTKSGSRKPTSAEPSSRFVQQLVHELEKLRGLQVMIALPPHDIRRRVQDHVISLAQTAAHFRPITTQPRTNDHVSIGSRIKRTSTKRRKLL